MQLFWFCSEKNVLETHCGLNNWPIWTQSWCFSQPTHNFSALRLFFFFISTNNLLALYEKLWSQKVFVKEWNFKRFSLSINVGDVPIAKEALFNDLRILLMLILKSIYWTWTQKKLFHCIFLIKITRGKNISERLRSARFLSKAKQSRSDCVAFYKIL